MLLIGLMSGTSLDGIDAALVSLEGEGQSLRWELQAFICVPWEPALRLALLDACRPDAPLQTVVALHFLVGEAFAEAARQVAQRGGVALESVDAIASHGQTLWHQPEPIVVAGREARGTLQVGDGNVIATRTGCVTVCDFRTADMARGGQGAPLVPFADYALFASHTETRVVQNIGGIANATFLRQNGELAEVIAFDTGTGNMLLDALVRLVTQGRQTYDDEGTLAAQGTVCQPLLDLCLAHPYFVLPPPKTTGREMFGQAYATWFAAEAQNRQLPMEDALATAVALTAQSITDAYHRFLPPAFPVQTVILGGGGVRNQSLVAALQARLPNIALRTHADYGLPDDAKEAVAFALLGYETLHRRPSNVPSATGATTPAILGKVCYP